jgi:hypothetical protein
MRPSIVPQYGVSTAVKEIEKSMATQPPAIQKSGTLTISSCSVEGLTTVMETGSDTYAGSRITEIYELLELCLLDLPIQDLLLAQRVNRRFNAVINTSPRLREKLFFTSRLAFGQAFKAKLNPLIVREDVMRAVPLFFDNEEKRLVGCYREDYQRLWCRLVTATTVWVYLEFCDEEPHGLSGVEEDEMGVLERGGSWERMFLSQPSCFVSWRVRLSRPVEETYCGIVKGARTMGALIDGLVDSLVVRQ